MLSLASHITKRRILPNNEKEWTKLNSFAWFVNLANNCDSTDEREVMVSGSVRQLICQAYMQNFHLIKDMYDDYENNDYD